MLRVLPFSCGDSILDPTEKKGHIRKIEKKKLINSTIFLVDLMAFYLYLSLSLPTCCSSLSGFPSISPSKAVWMQLYKLSCSDQCLQRYRVIKTLQINRERGNMSFSLSLSRQHSSSLQASSCFSHTSVSTKL